MTANVRGDDLTSDQLTSGFTFFGRSCLVFRASHCAFTVTKIIKDMYIGSFLVGTTPLALAGWKLPIEFGGLSLLQPAEEPALFARSAAASSLS